MRRTIRPFIKEFKSRSSKSSAPHPLRIDNADKDSPKPPFLDVGVFAAPRNTHDEYKAALKAADAVFGGSRSAAPIPEAAAPSNAPVGRVLPSLIEEEDPLTIRLTEADGKAAPGRRVKKAKGSSPVRRKKPAIQPKSDVAGVCVERSAANFLPETSIGPAPRRERRSIQKRWVLETELKAGEKWKRRLCKAAR